MNRTTALAAAMLAGVVTPAFAGDDFQLTFHVERHDASALSVEDCGDVVEREASRAGLRAGAQRFEGKLAVVSGGADRRGSFIVQCIAVDGKTVSVVQGIDYSERKGALGSWADATHAALSKAAR